MGLPEISKVTLTAVCHANKFWIVHLCSTSSAVYTYHTCRCIRIPHLASFMQHIQLYSYLTPSFIHTTHFAQPVGIIPTDTCQSNNVIITSKWRRGVVLTQYWRYYYIIGPLGYFTHPIFSPVYVTIANGNFTLFDVDKNCFWVTYRSLFPL